MKEVEREKRLTELKLREMEKKTKLEERIKGVSNFKGFLQKEAVLDDRLVKEVEERFLATSSKRVSEAAKKKAKTKWAQLEEEEDKEERPHLPVQRCRSLRADRNRKMLEAVGCLADQEEKMDVIMYNWLESNLCILAPVNSAQAAAFELMKVTGMLCSRHSTSVQKGRRFFVLAKEDEKFNSDKGGQEQAGPAERASPAQPVETAAPTSSTVPAEDMGSSTEASAYGGFEELLAVEVGTSREPAASDPKEQKQADREAEPLTGVVAADGEVKRKAKSEAGSLREKKKSSVDKSTATLFKVPLQLFLKYRSFFLKIKRVE
jgi:hypothetical protein